MRLIQAAQHADDLGRASSFYSILVGTPPVATFDPPGLVFFGLDGTRLLIDRAAPSALLYLPTGGIDADLVRLQSAGAALHTEPHMIFRHDDDTLGPAGTEEWHAFIRDPEGNLVGLVEHRFPTP
jgi:methylmalonyl-CoA/ethylmalonyl-CoA epimerase